MAMTNRAPMPLPADKMVPGCEAFDGNVLARTPLLAGLPEDCRCVLTDRMEPRILHAGDVVYAEGDTARELFIVAAGNLAVTKHGHALLDLHESDFFGEMSFLDMQPRGNTVTARGDVTLYAIPFSSLRSLYQVNMRMYALIVMNLAREVSRRLRLADERTAGTGA